MSCYNTRAIGDTALKYPPGIDFVDWSGELLSVLESLKSSAGVFVSGSTFNKRFDIVENICCIVSII